MYKKRQNSRMAFLVPIWLLACSFSVSAQTYLTLEGGKAFAETNVSHFKRFNASIDAAGGQARLRQTDTDTALAIGAGYQFHPNWGLELLYLNMGKASARSISADTLGAYSRHRTVTERVEQDALAANLVGRLPVQDIFVLKASLGLGLVRQKSRGQAEGQTLNASGQTVASTAQGISSSRTEWAPVIGLGAGYRIDDHWQLHLNWRRVANLNPDVLGSMDVDLFTLGVQYRF